MKLYHFTASHLIEKIKVEGLTLGAIPLSIGPAKVEYGYQWLTANPEFQQAWCDPAFSSFPYNRNDYRIKLNIPKTSMINLIPWILVWKELKEYIPLVKHLNDFGDPENWFVYHGKIPVKWFIEIREMF